MESDLISRQWLMECANEGWIKFDTEKDENRFIHLVRDIAPSAQPERINGRWIPWDEGDYYECSACGVLWTFTDGTPEENEANFCPVCGADMRGEQDEMD